jgi:hypothetical protein
VIALPGARNLRQHKYVDGSAGIQMMEGTDVAHCHTDPRHRRDERAAQQRDAADEGRLEASGSIMVGPVIVN